MQQDGGIGDPPAAAAVLLGQRDPDPAAFGHAGVEVPREAVLAVARGPVVVVEAGADVAHRFGDQLLIDVEEIEVVSHRRIVVMRRCGSTESS